MDTDLIKERNGDFFLTKKLSLIAIFQEKKFVSSLERLCVRYSDRGSKAFRIRAKKETFFFKRDAHMLWIPEWWSKKKLRIETKESFFSDFFLSFFFLSSKKKTTKTKIYFFAAQLRLSMALTTCRDGWLGFLFRWRTQQSAISGINCRTFQLPNLWTQMALGRRH